MYVRDIMVIVKTEESILEILKEHQVKDPKDIAIDIMEFILNSDLCDRAIRSAYFESKQQQKDKKR